MSVRGARRSHRLAAGRWGFVSCSYGNPAHLDRERPSCGKDTPPARRSNAEPFPPRSGQRRRSSNPRLVPTASCRQERGGGAERTDPECEGRKARRPSAATPKGRSLRTIFDSLPAQAEAEMTEQKDPPRPIARLVRSPSDRPR